MLVGMIDQLSVRRLRTEVYYGVWTRWNDRYPRRFEKH